MWKVKVQVIIEQSEDSARNFTSGNDERRSDMPKTVEFRAMLLAKSQVGGIWWVLGNGIWSYQLVPNVTKILQNFRLNQLKRVFKFILGFTNRADSKPQLRSCRTPATNYSVFHVLSRSSYGIFSPFFLA